MQFSARVIAAGILEELTDVQLYAVVDLSESIARNARLLSKARKTELMDGEPDSHGV